MLFDKVLIFKGSSGLEKTKNGSYTYRDCRLVRFSNVLSSKKTKVGQLMILLQRSEKNHYNIQRKGGSRGCGLGGG